MKNIDRVSCVSIKSVQAGMRRAVRLIKLNQPWKTGDSEKGSL